MHSKWTRVRHLLQLYVSGRRSRETNVLATPRHLCPPCFKTVFVRLRLFDFILSACCGNEASQDSNCLVLSILMVTVAFYTLLLLIVFSFIPIFRRKILFIKLLKPPLKTQRTLAEDSSVSFIFVPLDSFIDSLFRLKGYDILFK